MEATKYHHESSEQKSNDFIKGVPGKHGFHCGSEVVSRLPGYSLRHVCLMNKAIRFGSFGILRSQFRNL